MKLSNLLLAPYLLMLLQLAVAQQEGEQQSANNVDACGVSKIKLDSFVHKKTSYTIGIHATMGLDAVYDANYKLFGEFLTATAGKRFDPPVEFSVVPKYFDGIFEAIENDEMDFLYANPGVYSCIGTQVGATALATVVNRLDVRGRTFDLDVYGGVIAVRHDNDEINSIADLKEKVIGAGAIIDLMGGQMQIYEMGKAGMSYVNDPKQVVFTRDQTAVVHGLLDGRFDAGFVRTDQIELTKDADGNLVDPDLFKIIEPKIHVMDSGDLFPFLHSTDIFPEWPLAALSSVPRDIQQAVQGALMDFGQHAEMGDLLNDCLANRESQWCDSISLRDMIPNAPCDANKDLVLLAAEASERSHIVGFRTARSYHYLRTMQQEAGFLVQDDKNDWYCTRPSNLWEGITCPEGFFKRHEDEFHGGCGEVGLDCAENEDYVCFCKPCVKAFEVDVYHIEDGKEDPHLQVFYGDALPGCEKMSICGTIEQGQSITLRVYDNMARPDAVVEVVAHAGDRRTDLKVANIEGTHAYEFTLFDDEVQVQVIDILVNGKPISQSPIRVVVKDKDCEAVHGIGSHRVPDDMGNCVCAGHTYEMGGTCMESPYFFLILFAAVFIVIGVLVFFYLGYKKKQSDTVWHINAEELHFNEPPEVIGQGGFGVVILGEYRGTKVAVKRVLPPAKVKLGSRSLTSSGHNFGGTSGEIPAASIQSNGTVRKSNKGTKNVKFGEDSGDIESQHTASNSGSMQLRGSFSGSNKEWERLMAMDQSDNDILRILESATASDHGSSAFYSGSVSATQHFIIRWLPMGLRFDEHSKRVTEFVTEMRMLSRLRHPCITTVMGAVVTNKVDPMLVMEYMEYGSLYDLLHNETMTPGGEIILQVIRDIVQGIQFLHASKPPILHGDLKAKNILVDSRFRAKVADFGFSHLKGKKQKSVLQGTPFYMAPEYLRRRSEYTSACDIYSVAMIIYEIYARAGPFEGEDPRKILPKVCHPRLNKRPPVPETCPPKMVELMKKCWNVNAFFRPSAKDLDFALVEMSSQDTDPLETAKDKALKKLKPKATSLYDVFPKHVADALNAGKKVEAESHEMVTIVFSDIVGFTAISQQLSGMKVSTMLDRLYHAFDELSRKHHIFKVETIGDAYMGVTNLDGNEFETHVKQVAEYAQDAIRAAANILIDEENPAMGYVQIRVGLHSGPVVSNVIGSLNPRYGLFGDTVNTASRMESNSRPSKIHCSNTSAQLLQQQAPDIPMKLRGMIKVKGKGKMKTYWVGDEALLKPMAPNLMISAAEPMDPLSERSEEDHIHHNCDDSELTNSIVDGDISAGNHHDHHQTKDEIGVSHRTDDTQLLGDSSSDIIERDHYIKVHSASGGGAGAGSNKKRSTSTTIQMDGSVQKVLEVSPSAKTPSRSVETDDCCWPSAPVIE
jgi:guanylate cyclase